MSRDPADRPRRRPRPAPSDSVAEPDPTEADETSTWQPAARPKKRAKAAPVEPREPRAEVGGPNWLERLVFGRVSTAHKASFSRQLAAYLAAGVDLTRSFGALGKQFARTAFGPVIGRLGLSVRRGEALGDAFAREAAAFDPTFLAMIRVAETRGTVPETLRLMADHYEARVRLFRQARSALIYPAVVVVFALAVVLLLGIFVLPALVGMLAEMGRGRANLPGPTRVLIALSGFLQTMGWWLIPALLIGGFFGTVRAYRTPAGKAMLDAIALRLPVFGGLLRKIDTARFARTLAALLEGGVDVLHSLDLTADTLATAPLRRAVRSARAAVVEGVELNAALGDSGWFTPDVVAIVETGEETGKLPESLDRLADDYQDQVEHTVKNLGSLVQPLIVVVLGGIVLFIALAFVMAYVSMLAGL